MGQGVGTLTDSIDFYIENSDFAVTAATPPVKTSVGLNVTATATQTVNGADLTNTMQPGAIFYVAFGTIQATCTVRINVQGKDPASGLYFTIASLSVDNVTVTSTLNNPSNTFLSVYPGATISNGTNVPTQLPRTFRVQASITVINATTTNAATLTVGMSRTMG